MAEHTPGPWTLDTTTGTPAIRSLRIGWVAAIMRHYDRSEQPYDLPNARLIAAAPDLLAACKALIEAKENEMPGHRNNAVCDALNAMDRAVAKAEGRA